MSNSSPLSSLGDKSQREFIFSQIFASMTTAQSGTPNMIFSGFGEGAGTNISAKYFQYRLFMESDDLQQLCAGGTQTCTPELESVSVGLEQ